ncbi:MAG: AAA family ATPase [Acidobacteria bacterium]|nr:AAA family ATPase [Acidobacteriota bacterium]
MSANVLLVDSTDRQLEELIRSGGATLTRCDLTQFAALGNPGTSNPGVIVLDGRRDPELPPSLKAVKRQHPGIGIIVVAESLDPTMMLEAMRAGVNEFVTEPLTAEDLRAAIARVSALQPSAESGKIFAFLGAKGGVGTTTVAVNVATALAQSGTGRVLFVDLHPAHGDAALFFGAEPKFSVLDALENTHRLDDAYLKGLVVRTKSGLDLLASSDRSAVAAPDAQRVRALIDFVASYYTYVVLDVPRSDSAALDALDGTSNIIIVANQELSTVRGAARMGATLRQRYGKERVQVVVSRYDAAAAFGQEDIERVTGGAIRHVFPSNYRLAVDALNKGCPLVVENHNKLAGAIVGFARGLAGITPQVREEPARPAGLLGRLTGRR